LKSLARAARVNSKQIARGAGMTEEQATKLGKAAKIVRERSNIHIHDSGSATVATIRAEATKLQRQQSLGLVVVDYLQLMQGSGQEKRNDEVAEISRGLKLLAKKLHVPVLALSQMNRAIESRHDKRPNLSDLRDSGAIEQDADVVLFLHQEANYDPDKEPDGTIEVIVAKNRAGETGTVKLAFNQGFSTFKTLPT
jgi:replicative DNA helicase